MHIPGLAGTPYIHTTSLPDVFNPYAGTQPGSGSDEREWSSLIGIVTAIVGNILISFALNIQRYAHIRIDREYDEARRVAEDGALANETTRSYGSAQQEEIAAQRGLELNLEESNPDISSDESDAGPDARLLQEPSHPDQSRPHHEKDVEDEHGRTSYLKSPYWWCGIVLMAIGEAGNFIAYGFAPASIVSPLGVVGLISNCLIAPLMLKEHFRRRDFFGVLVAITGAVTVVLSARQSEEKLSPEDLLANIKRWEFGLYITLTLVAIIVLMSLSPQYGRRTILVDLGLVGLFGGYTVLSTKGVASLLSASLWKAFTYPIFYFSALGLAISALMQIRYLNLALQNYSSTEVIPIQFVLFTLSVILGSAVLYRDFESMASSRAVKFITGCLLTFFGVYLITSGPQRWETRDDRGPCDESDEPIRLIDEEAQAADERTSRKQAHSHPASGQPNGQARGDYNALGDGMLTPRRLSNASSLIPSIAVTPAESDFLTTNPWLSSTDHLDDQSKPSANFPTTPPINRLPDQESAPFSTSSTSHRLQRAISSPVNSATPTPGARDTTPPRADEPSPSPNFLRSARGSISRLFPGPLIPPLSSSLNAVVADSVRRGEGSPRTSKEYPRRYRTLHPAHERRHTVATDEESARPSAELTRQHSQDSLPIIAVRDRADGEDKEEGDAAQQKSRLRAMSETLTGMVTRNKRERRDDSNGGSGGGSESPGSSQQPAQEP